MNIHRNQCDMIFFLVTKYIKVKERLWGSEGFYFNFLYYYYYGYIIILNIYKMLVLCERKDCLTKSSYKNWIFFIRY